MANAVRFDRYGDAGVLAVADADAPTSVLVTYSCACARPASIPARSRSTVARFTSAGPRHSARPVPTRAPPAQARQAARRQGLRLRPPAATATRARNHTPHRPQRRRVLSTSGQAPLDRRTDHGLAQRYPPAPPPLRTQSRPLPRLRQHRLHPHLLPQTHQMRRLLDGPRVGRRTATPAAAGPALNTPWHLHGERVGQSRFGIPPLRELIMYQQITSWMALPRRRHDR